MKKNFETLIVKIVLVDDEDLIKTSGEIAWWGTTSGGENI